MDEIVKEYVISFFDRNLRMYGDRPEAVGWSSKGQLLRYKSMLDIGDIKDTKVLDFGCGKGDFYNFLNSNGIKVKYTGVDINEKLISVAKMKYPYIDFRVFDIDQDILDEDFDYIFLCGVFNLKVEGLDEIIERTLIKLFHYCRKALAFNALSSQETRKDFQLHYISPDEIIEFATKHLSPHVSLGHEKIPYDLTIFVYRDINLFSYDR